MNQEFQKLPFFNNVLRPDWDTMHLPELGFRRVSVVPRVNEHVYDQEKQLLYRSIPLFMVLADK